MKRSFKTMLGATLLEVMLVLAIAAMIIVMSIRYYQTAQTNQQANSILSQVTGIVTAVDQLVQTTGSYLTANAGGAINNAAISNMLPAGGLMTPWGSNITVTGATANTFTVAIPNIPSGVCPLLRSKLLTNNKFTVTTGTCGAGASSFTYTYDSQK